MFKTIARITSTFLGASEDTHGCFTAQIGVSYSNGPDTEQTAGGPNLGRDKNGFTAAFIRGVLTAAGVSSWEELKGRTVLVLTEHDPDATGGFNPILGFAPLPTEPGLAFVFSELADQYRSADGAR